MNTSPTPTPETIDEFFDLKYGKAGTKTRREFEANAEAYWIAEMIRQKRKEIKLTQQQLADKLNVERAYISKIERAVSEVRISTLRKVIEEGLGGKLHIRIEL